MKCVTTLMLALCSLTACSDDPSTSAPEAPPCLPEQVEALRWKRSDALFADLAAALVLDLEAQCLELGDVSCAKAHRVALGGSAPFESTLYVPLREPLVITPLVTERVVLASCAARASMDAATAPDARVVFDALDFEAAALTPDAPGIDATTGVLYQRLLGRAATAEERSRVRQLALDADARSFATLACFAVGTSTEFLFF